MITKQSSIFIIFSLLILSGVSANAREFKEYPSSVRDDNGKIIRTGYITNAWYDNWVISAGAGASLDDAEKANRKLTDDNAALRDRNSALEDEINALKAVAASEAERNGEDELLRRIAGAGLVIYYDIDVFQIRSCEELHINDYVNEVLKKDPAHVFYLTGSADKRTGTYEGNTFLSTNRVNRVKTYLMNKFDIPASRIVIKGATVTDEHEDGRIDRCVLFENE